MEEERKSGSVQLSDYEADAYLRKLEPVLQQLQKDIPEAKYDKRGLAQLVAQLLQFMEVALGINALPPKPHPKIPAKLFRDYSPYGSLYSIAVKCHELMQQRGIKRLDFQSVARRKENLDFLSQIRRELQREGYLKTPKVFIHSSCSGDMPRLQRIIGQLGGELMPSEKTPGVTHIVHPFGPKGDVDDGVEYIRCLEKRGTGMLVHFWYYPDSYDRCIPASLAPETVEHDKRIKGPWKVTVRWVYDSEKYNEWMNPVDYETEEAVAEQDRLGLVIEPDNVGSGVVTKRPLEGAEGEEPSAKRQRPDHKASAKKSTVEAGRAEPVAPGVVRQRLVQPEPRWTDAGTTENLSQGQLRPSTLRGPGSKTPRARPPARTPAAEAAAAVGNGIPAEEPPKVLYRVPAHAAWFKYDQIHANELRGVPDYFAGIPMKTPRAYIEARNFIINKYREDTSRRLSFAEVRAGLEGDAGGLQRIYSFLDHWGLINYQADGTQQAASDVNPFAIAPSNLPGTVRLGRLPGPPNANALLSFHTPPAGNFAAAAATGAESTLHVITRRDQYTQPANQAPTGEARFFCNAMPWVDCTTLRYHCTKMPDVDLCPEAFAEGRFPPGCTARDFIRIDAAQPSENPKEWTDQETLLLLEGLELYGDNWAETAEHVGTKSQVQCIMHFLQMPIEDEFLSQLVPQQPPGVAMRNSGPALDSSEQPIPFADVGNPVMAQVAFLASMVSPKVAAASAARALEVLGENDPAVLAEAQYMSVDDSNEKEKEPAGETVSSGEIAEGGAAAEGNEGERACGPPSSSEEVRNDHGASTSCPQANGSQTPANSHAQRAPDGPISTTKARIAAATALSAAAARARLLADAEEREAQRLASEAMEAMLKRLERKLQQFSALEEALIKEKALAEDARDKAVAERVQLQNTPPLTLQLQAQQQLAAAQKAAAAAAAATASASTPAFAGLGSLPATLQSLPGLAALASQPGGMQLLQSTLQAQQQSQQQHVSQQSLGQQHPGPQQTATQPQEAAPQRISHLQHLPQQLPPQQQQQSQQSTQQQQQQQL
ncbi:g9330 [Coccomyxa elongata]